MATPGIHITAGPTGAALPKQIYREYLGVTATGPQPTIDITDLGVPRSIVLRVSTSTAATWAVKMERDLIDSFVGTQGVFIGEHNNTHGTASLVEASAVNGRFFRVNTTVLTGVGASLDIRICIFLQ